MVNPMFVKVLDALDQGLYFNHSIEELVKSRLASMSDDEKDRVNIVVVGDRVVGLVTSEGTVDVAENLFFVDDGGPYISLYGMYNGVKIPIGYGAQIQVPNIVLNYVGIELAAALTGMSNALASIKLLSTDFNVDFENCIVSTKLDGTPVVSYFERSVELRQMKDTSRILK